MAMNVDSLSHLPMAKQRLIREQIEQANQHFREMVRRWQSGEPFGHFENEWAKARKEVDRLLHEVQA
jgi:anti-sigma-K factor RskA